ncbi:AP-4 complex subunit epsilon-1 [Biomphalaria glabrata]|nr:AP-4 complex subunit epsilon-1 [Biomphalaria glabrata]
MSHIMEKTLAALPKLLTQTLIGGKSVKSPVQQVPNKEVQMFMSFVHRARSKTHEAAIVHSELTSIQQKLKQADQSATSSVIKNSFTKAIFCHLLGYDVSFIVIYAVNLTQQGKGYDKRLGYLLCCLLLHPHHEMVILIMATLLRDLKSSSMGDNCLALLVAGQLVSEENVPTILPEVMKKLNHSSDLVKEKALYCLRAFYQCAPALMQSSVSHLSNFLESRDPGVLSATVNIFLLLISDDPSRYISLASSFLHILQQIGERGFGSSYYYHMVPLPWLQINLLKILGHLGSVDPKLQEPISAKLQMLIEKTKVTESISLAILVESVLTATKINANDNLLQLCSRCIGKLLSPEAGNAMRYQGLGLLISLSKVKVTFTVQHQMAVIDCLSDDDPSIQLRTTYLLHTMANKSNIKAICVKLFEQAHKTSDKVLIMDMVHMISDLAERMSPSIDWYIETCFKIFELKNGSVDHDHFTELVISRIEKTLLAEQHIPDEALKNFIAHILHALEKHTPSHPSFVLSVRLVGAFAPQLGSNLPAHSFLETVEKLLIMQDAANVMAQQNTVPEISATNSVDSLQGTESYDLSRVKCYCLTSTMKLILAGCLDVLTFKMWFYKHDYRKLAKDANVICYLDELEELIQHTESLDMRSKVMFHPDQAEIDLSLSFLDLLVVQELLQDKEPYKPAYIKSIDELLSFKIDPLHTDTSASNVETEKLLQSRASSVVPGLQTKSVFKNKWRDDESEDQYLDMNEDPTDELDIINKRKEDLAKELFSGLSESNPTLSNMPVKNVKLSNRQLWEDNEDTGLHLNPFGLTRKARSPQSQRWFDEDLENDNMTLFGLDNFISCQSEKIDSPANDSLYVEGLALHNLSMGSGNSNYLGDSWVPGSGAMSVSTVDTLTDSDPDNTES